jgi:hypothetical protein
MNIKYKELAFFLIVFGVINSYAQQIKLSFELSKDKKAIFIKLPMENQKDILLFFFKSIYR